MTQHSLRRAALCLIAATLVAAPRAASAETHWTVDPGHSSALFTVRHLVVSNVRGIIPIREATVLTDSGSTMPTAIAATLDAAKLNSQNDDRDAQLRGSDWLDVTKYPTISFKSTKVVPGADGAFSATGDLTIHGVTKSVTLTGTTLGVTTDSRGRRHVGYEATTTIDRHDFGLNWAKTVPGGGLVAANTVSISLEIEAASAE